jgi:hypothetical protein
MWVVKWVSLGREFAFSHRDKRLVQKKFAELQDTSYIKAPIILFDANVEKQGYQFGEIE